MDSLLLAYPEKMNMYFLLVNSQNEISEVVHDVFPFSSSEDESADVLIPFSFLITKIKSFASHQLMHSFVFQVDMDAGDDLEETDVSHFMNQYFKPLAFLNDIVISPSLPLFHSLNSLFFVLKEKTKPRLTRLEYASDSDIVDSLMTEDIVKTRKHYPRVIHGTRKR